MIKKFNEFKNSNLVESSMSKIIENIVRFECAIITAFRYADNCGFGERYSWKQNQARNKKLYAQLNQLKYSTTEIKGIFIENWKSDQEHEVEENSFFVANSVKDINFKQNILNLGNEYEQDSIFYIYNYMDQQGRVIAEMISTNECEFAYPGFGKLNVSKKYNKIEVDKINQFMSKIGNKNFFFTEEIAEKSCICYQGNLQTRKYWSDVAKMDWRDLIEK